MVMHLVFLFLERIVSATGFLTGVCVVQVGMLPHRRPVPVKESDVKSGLLVLEPTFCLCPHRAAPVIIYAQLRDDGSVLFLLRDATLRRAALFLLQIS
ncbi:hypothetical protein J6590_033543 [Homalodisca vitripennis]|nr:hypothetical protein J6590_033543 [Homalodisca vitripennis]